MAGRYLHGVRSSIPSPSGFKHDARLDGLGQCVQQILDLARLLSDGVQGTRIGLFFWSVWSSEWALIAKMIAGCASDLRHDLLWEHGGGQTVRIAARSAKRVLRLVKDMQAIRCLNVGLERSLRSQVDIKSRISTTT